MSPWRHRLHFKTHILATPQGARGPITTCAVPVRPWYRTIPERCIWIVGNLYAFTPCYSRLESPSNVLGEGGGGGVVRVGDRSLHISAPKRSGE